MAIIKMTLSFLKKQKAYAITIFCMVWIVTLMLTVAVTLIRQSGRILQDAYEKASCPDVFGEMGEEDYRDEYLNDLRKREEVEGVIKTEASYVERLNVDMDGIESSGDLYVTDYSPSIHDYEIITPDNQTFSLNKGEILLPLLLEKEYSLRIGDRITIYNHSYTLAGFYEDPMCGSSMISIKRALLQERDFKDLYEEGENKLILLSIFIKERYRNGEYKETVKKLCQEFGFDYLARYDVEQYVLLFPNLMAATLISFAVLSLFILLFVLRYAILSSVEGSFVTIGACKAIGFTSRQIRLSILLQYALVSVPGMCLGILAGVPIIPIVGELLANTAGLLWKGGVLITAIFLIPSIFLTVICLMSWMGTRGIHKISPVRAIAFGKAPVYFAKRLNVPLKRLSLLPLHLRMAVKQMVVRRKQYVILTVITVLLTFMVTYMNGFSGIFRDFDALRQIMGYAKSDINIYMYEETEDAVQRLNEMLVEIKEEYDVASVYETGFENINIENEAISAIVYGQMDGIGLGKPIAGRFPKYDNEIALSPVLSEYFEKDIGDTVTLSYGEGKKEEFMVTGLVERIDNMGWNFSILTSGVKRLKSDYEPNMRGILFGGGTDVESAVTELKNAYQTEDGKVEVSSTLEKSKQQIESFQSLILPVTGVAYLLAVVLISLITLLLAVIAIYRENTDIGVFKSIGFTTGQIRMQFAIRFCLVALTGGLCGIVLSLWLSNPLTSFVFGFFGITRVNVILSVPETALSIGLVCMVALTSAWLVSRRVKAVSCKNLIWE